MTHSTLLRWVAALWMAMTSAVAAQSFTEQVSGTYTTAPDFEFAVQLTLWPEGDGFAGDALIAAARYPVYAEQDGPALRGVFDVEGTLQRFTFLPSKSGQVAIQFSGEPAPILMTRTALPEFVGRYSGDFGTVTVRRKEGQLSAELADLSGEVTHGVGITQGVRATFPDLATSIYFDAEKRAYYLDMPAFFGPVTPERVPLRVGKDDTADFDTISDALAAAASGSKIELLPGHYGGPFLVSQHVEISGVGEPGSVVLTGDKEDVMVWTAPRGALTNVTIKTPTLGTGVRLEDGSASLLGVAIEVAQGATGVAATGAGEVLISKSSISGGDHAVKIVTFAGAVRLSDISAQNTQKSIVSAKKHVFGVPAGNPRQRICRQRVKRVSTRQCRDGQTSADPSRGCARRHAPFGRS